MNTTAHGIIPARAGFTGDPRHPGLDRRDHPRSRGVYSTAPITAPRPAGSSPLARGLPTARETPTSSGGIIPARAGFTALRAARVGRRADHPRSRGVYPVANHVWHCSLGSSPLARGLRFERGVVVEYAWIIPARAGFTRPTAGDAARFEDHPRSRGVYRSRVSGRLPTRGSSPLARGLRRGIGADRETYRIIPARAGFTPRGRSPHLRPGDHPRSRGVYTGRAAESSRPQGSSPLARGLLRAMPDGGTKVGIIPARAGFTSEGDQNPGPREDHPRSRGVYTGSHGLWRPPPGSSPLARGLLDAPPHRREQGEDHPRSRGVYGSRPGVGASGSGSSPLARGLLYTSVSTGTVCGIIPARAGFTGCWGP